MKKTKIKSIWDMDVFKLAHLLTIKVYKITKKYPKFEIYALVSQMRRAASAIPMNLAEGAARNSKAEYRRFACIARGSVGEISYQILLSRDLCYIDTKTAERLINDYNRVGRMLTGLIQSLESK